MSKQVLTLKDCGENQVEVSLEGERDEDSTAYTIARVAQYLLHNPEAYTKLIEEVINNG